MSADNCHLNIIIHNVEESSAEDGNARKSHDIDKCKDLFQTYLATTVTINKAFCLEKQSTKPRLLKITVILIGKCFHLKEQTKASFI